MVRLQENFHAVTHQFKTKKTTVHSVSTMLNIGASKFCFNKVLTIVLCKKDLSEINYKNTFSWVVYGALLGNI